MPLKSVQLTLPTGTEPSPQLVNYCLERYQNERDRYKILKRYYDNDNDILYRWFADPSLPNNRMAHAFAAYISSIATGYFMGVGVKLGFSEDVDEAYKEAITAVLDSNYVDSSNFESAKEMSVCGVAYELLYINSEGEICIKSLPAQSVIPVYSSGVEKFLEMAIIFSEENCIDGKSLYFADVYTKLEIVSYQKTSGGWHEIDRKSHIFGSVPVIIRRNNSDRKGDFENVISQIDAYDRAQSDTMNDLDFFTDAYLTVTGADEIVNEEPGEAGEVVQKPGKVMRHNRVLYMPEGGKADFLVKNINDTATENFKTRTYKDIFFLSQVPNLTDESFSGNLSGVAQKYKLLGLDGLADEKSKYWKSAERKRLKLITNVLNIRHGTSWDSSKITVTFDRSQIANTLEISQIMASLRGILSDETVVGLWPGVKDSSAELERRMNEETEARKRENGGIY